MKVIIASGKEVLVDDEDFPVVSRIYWTVHSAGYARAESFSGRMFMHNLIMGSNRVVDHINGNKLDNQKCNLRHATASQNLANRGKQINNTSGYKGAFFNKDRFRNKPWFSTIRFEGKIKRLGYFKTAEEAARVYDKAAKELHGDFAHLNFPEE